MTLGPTPKLPHSTVAGPEMAALPRIRLTWMLLHPDHATWRNEFTLDGETSEPDREICDGGDIR